MTELNQSSANPHPFPPWYRVSAKAIVFDETGTRFLLFHEKKGTWDFPGGGMETGESVSEALTRELREEAGLSVASVGETPYHFFTVAQGIPLIWRANIVYQVTLGEGEFVPSSECIEMRYMTAEEAHLLPLHDGARVFVEWLLNSHRISTL